MSGKFWNLSDTGWIFIKTLEKHCFLSKPFQLFLESVGHRLTLPCFFSVVRKKVCQVKFVVIIISGYSLQNIGHPFTRVYIQSLTGFNQRIHDGRIFSRIMIATEQIIFSAYRHSSDAIFNQVIQTFG